MHNLKIIRDNPNIFKKKTLDRNVNINFEKLLDLDKKNREIIQKKEKLEQEKKIISKSKDKSQFEKSKKISKDIELLENSQKDLQKEIESILNFIPNLPLDDVPLGKDDKSNKELKKTNTHRKKITNTMINLILMVFCVFFFCFFICMTGGSTLHTYGKT